jgi:hypothetical protein
VRPAADAADIVSGLQNAPQITIVYGAEIVAERGSAARALVLDDEKERSKT